jgi:peptide/nickel transport system permease protein
MNNRGTQKLGVFWKERLGFRLSGFFLLFYLVCALGAHLFPLPFGPDQLDLQNIYLSPFDANHSSPNGGLHLLGTDNLGRDVLANLIYGCRTSFFIGFTVMGLATLVGLGLGSVAGFFGDRTFRVSYATLSTYLLALPLAWFYGFYRRQYVLLDAASASPSDLPRQLFISLGIIILVFAVAKGLVFLLNRVASPKRGFYLPLDQMVLKLIEIVTAIPRLILILCLAAFMYPSLPLLMLLLAVSYWAGPARLVRAELQKVAGLTYIQAAESLGLPLTRIFFRHAIPNALGPVAVAFTFGVASLLALESTLSFLGIGIPANLPSWGRMMVGIKMNLSAWWLVLFPGIFLSLVVLSLQTCSYYLQKAYLSPNN